MVILVGVAERMTFRRCTFDYTGVFDEIDASPSGSVAVIQRFGCSGLLTIEDCTFNSTCIPLMDGHTNGALDPIRNTTDQPTILRNNRFRFVMGTETGPADVRACVDKKTRGLLESYGNIYEMDASAATKATDIYACIFASISHTAGTSTVRSVNDTFIFSGRAAGVSGTGNRQAPVVLGVAGGAGALNAEFHGARIRQGAYVNHTFSGAVGPTITGALDCSAAATFEQSPTLGGMVTVAGAFYLPYRDDVGEDAPEGFLRVAPGATGLVKMSAKGATGNFTAEDGVDVYVVDGIVTEINVP
jgi:hypothetical protein